MNDKIIQYDNLEKSLKIAVVDVIVDGRNVTFKPAILEAPPFTL